MDSDNGSVFLYEDDIPGASLGKRDVGTLKIPELKRLLQYQNTSMKGLKVDLITRYCDGIEC